MPGATWAKGGPVSISQAANPSAGWRSALTELGLHCGYGFPVHTSNGRTFAVLTFYAHEIDTPDNEIERLLSTVSAQLNIFAERQRAQEERRRLQQELVDRERLAAVGETAATLAHEIGNPLNVMYMQAQLLRRQLAKVPDLDPKLMGRVEMLLAENVRLAELLQDFRAMSRRDELRLARSDIGSVLEQLLTLQQPLLEMGAVDVVRDIAPELPPLMVDESKLKQVLINLIKNAVEAMPSGGQLTVRAAAEGKRLTIDIIDTGIGLPEDIDVFEPFRTTKATGTGLGLSVARRVLSAHGGSIACSSAPGSGAAFRIVLPVRSDLDG